MTATGTPEVVSTMALPVTRPTRSRLAALPIVSDIAALGRFFRDKKASFAGKAFLILTVAYVIMPVDAIPDVAPVVGWLDDLGMVAIALGYVMKVTKRYQEPEVEPAAK